MDFRTVFPVALAATVFTATALSGASHGQNGPHAAQIKARQSVMQLYAFNLGQLGAMAQGKMEYDAATAQAAADNLVALSGMNLMAMWPEGSDNASHPGTRALPEIWKNLPDVGAKLKAVNQAAMAMQAAAGADLVSVQGAMGALGGACGACHKAYRQPQ